MTSSSQRQPSSNEELARSLSQQLDEKQKDWQKEVERMQRDFFKDEASPISCRNDQNQMSCSDGRIGAGSTFQFLPDGSRVYRVRIDVSEFSPEELSVQTDTNRRQLVVKAVQSTSTATGGQRKRQMNKTIDLPDDVDVNRLVSRLANDGLLTIEAPVAPPTYRAVAKSRDTSTPTNQRAEMSHVVQQQTTMPQDHTEQQLRQPGTDVITTAGGQEVLRIAVQLSRSDFQPSDVLVVAYGSKLRVVARQEVTSASAGVMTSRREFSRELDVTRPVVRSTLRAALQCDTGLLSIAAVIMTPSSSSSSSSSAAAVASVLPNDAALCCVELR